MPDTAWWPSGRPERADHAVTRVGGTIRSCRRARWACLVPPSPERHRDRHPPHDVDTAGRRPYYRIAQLRLAVCDWGRDTLSGPDVQAGTDGTFQALVPLGGPCVVIATKTLFAGATCTSEVSTASGVTTPVLVRCDVR